MKSLKITILTFVVLFSTQIIIAQVGIGTIIPNSILDIRATDSITPDSTDGLLIPRIRAFPIAPNTPNENQNGMMVYLTADDGSFAGKAFYFWENGQWNSIKSNNKGNHYVGEEYGGGVVFYIWDDGEHGLIASPVNLNSNSTVVWSTSNSDISGAESPTDGQANTTAIVADQGAGTYAAKLCDDYSVNGFSDWYLPAVWELNIMYNNAFAISTVYAGGNEIESDPEGDYRYWSSTQKDNDEAWAEKIMEGKSEKRRKTSETYYVRACRSF